MPESPHDRVPFLQWTLSREQVEFLELVGNHGLMARAALKAMGKSFNQLGRWLHDPDFPDFAPCWRDYGKFLLAMHTAEDAQDLLVDAHEEIHALSGENIKKASALANVARSRADYKFRAAERMSPKEWGAKTQIEAQVEHRAVLMLPPLNPLPPLHAPPTEEAEVLSIEEPAARLGAPRVRVEPSRSDTDSSHG